MFHDDQHGTAVVVLAALLNALTLTGRRIEDIRIVIVGIGAAGVAVTQILIDAGARHIIGCDSRGALSVERAGLPRRHDAPGQAGAGRGHEPRARERRASRTCSRAPTCSSACRGRGFCEASALARMNPDPIVFAMANPKPEVAPEEAAPYARIMATGRSDYPNQINNVLCFPGIFRGALDVRAVADHRGDEDRRRAARSPTSSPATSCARTTSSRRCSTATWSPRSPPRSPSEARESGTAEAGAELGFAQTEEFGVLGRR